MTAKSFLFFLTLLFVLGALSAPVVSFAQPKFYIYVSISDSGLKTATTKLHFGVHPNSVRCNDNPSLPATIILRNFATRWFEAESTTVIEQDGPPPSPATDIRFSQPLGCGIITGPYLEDIKPYLSSTQIDTFRLKIVMDETQGDDLHAIKFSWPTVLSEFADSVILQKTGVPSFRIDMTKQSSFIFYQGIVTTSKNVTGFSIIMKGPKTPPGLPLITTTAPINGATGVSLTPTFQWNSVPQAAYYRFQLAKDTLFTGPNLIRTDSLAGSATSLTLVSSLVQNTVYYWRILVSNPHGVSLYQSPPLQFQTLVTCPDPPVLIAPANNATDIAVSGADLSWHKAVSGSPVVAYHVQVSSTSNFAAGTIVVNDSSITDTTYTAATLNNCVKYYWHVRALNAQCWSNFSTDRNFRIALTTPSAPALTSPADGGINIPVSPLLSWTGDACSDSYHLEVSLDAGFSALAVDQTLNLPSATIGPLLDDTVYYWRVTAMNASFTGSPSATRSFRTALAPPPAPVLISPAVGANVTIPPPPFAWSSSRKATSYRFEVSKAVNFSSLLYVDSTHSDTTNTPSGLQNCQSYYWRVRAKNAQGTSAFTAARLVHGERAIPADPALTFPAHGQTGVGESVTLQWNPSDSCINSYVLHVSTNVNAVAPFFLNETLSAKQQTIGPLTAFTKYYWRVQGLNEVGVSAGDTSSFVVSSTAPPPPNLVFPKDGVGGISVNPTLVWDTSARATKYRLQVAYDAGFTLLAVNDSTINQPATAQVSKQVGPLPNTTTFYWRVYARNATGVGDPSATRTFATLSPPPAPTLVSPANNAVDVSVLPTFFWTIADGSDTYRLQVSRDSVFSLIVFDDSTIVATTKQINVVLSSKTKYFWRVRGKNSTGYGALSVTNGFTTQRTGQANWVVPVSICETGPACDTIFFGINPSATFGIDPFLGEYELPQSGQFGWFDARWIDNVSPSRIGEGLRFNLHGFRNYSQVDTFRMRFQPGTGSYPMNVSWSKAYVATLGDSMVIKDEFGGVTAHARMDLVSSLSVTNANISTLLVITYGAFPLDVKPIDIPEIPKGFMLSQNYPNPFNPTTRMQFSTDERADIQITVYDVLGNEITRLASSMYYPGAYALEWNGKNDRGLQMPSGIYYVRMIGRTISSDGAAETAPFTMMRKMIMMK